MMNDSVREELKDRISTAPKLIVNPNPPAVAKPVLPVANVKAELPVEPLPKPLLKQTVAAAASAPAVKSHTSEITAKPTSPTLVEFQNKNATVPEWRLQLQNAVRKRVETVPSAPVEMKPMVGRVQMRTSGANALKAEIVEEAAPVVLTGGNPKLANALKRIEESRKRFLANEPKEEIVPKPPPAGAAKNYPFYIATKNAEILPKPAEIKAEIKPAAPAVLPPKLEDLPVIEKKPYDTNKLKALPNAAVISTNLEKVSGDLPPIEAAIIDAPLIKISRVKTDDDEEILYSEEGEFVEADEEAEDLAPFAMRFNAGLFDLIIGGFTALVLLAPFMLSKGGNWFSLAGFLAFLVTCAIVMFVYLTTAIGMFGKSVGMKIFSLETIDIEENDYPTFHQAAVSSSVYLVSLALGGIGFLPALFNSERRTAPDLLSGTIIVKEY
ncbi:MAG TPA: RDD family protein [Pyrinomonadaceae bacterium]|jgi:uncharacterized RDD family membrane protein YckC